MAQQAKSPAAVPISRDELEAFLEGTDFPATKRELLDVAYDNGAPDHTLEMLNSIPDQEYYSLEEVLLTLQMF